MKHSHSKKSSSDFGPAQIPSGQSFTSCLYSCKSRRVAVAVAAMIQEERERESFVSVSTANKEEKMERFVMIDWYLNECVSACGCVECIALRRSC